MHFVFKNLNTFWYLNCITNNDKINKCCNQSTRVDECDFLLAIFFYNNPHYVGNLLLTRLTLSHVMHPFFTILNFRFDHFRRSVYITFAVL